MNPVTVLLPESITLIDAQYLHPAKSAVYMITEGNRAAFIDTNTNHAVPIILETLKARGFAPEQVDYIILTHIHLDHAGGTGKLLESCPNATVLAHPRAARHAADPSRLIAGARALYGDEQFDALYGEIVPVPESRLRAMEDGETLIWGTRTLTFFHTRGHANHHFSIHDSATRSVFAGDNFGLGRNAADTHGPVFLMCTSSPVEFDGPEALLSVQKILDKHPEWIFIGHYGAVNDIQAGADQVLHSIRQMEAIRAGAVGLDLDGDALDEWCEARVWEAFNEHLTRFGSKTLEEDLAYLRLDAFLNARGLSFTALKERKAKAAE
ncbi:MAG: MBL fold metallo-hydrolase [Candidatus Hydrogenedentes bacterium]|nr:MBL fold metallo-hydrolase [Candidatus Hydrogenedentota bacterium]